MMPVEATRTRSSGIRRCLPTISVISRASRIPCSPVATFEHPLEATIAWATPLRRRSRVTFTGAPWIRLVVKTPAAVAGVEEYTRARSRADVALMPACKPGREDPRDRGDAAVGPLEVAAADHSLPKNKPGRSPGPSRGRLRAIRTYRFENWKRLRAPGCPYFFRSFIRGSRVSIPARFS